MATKPTDTNQSVSMEDIQALIAQAKEEAKAEAKAEILASMGQNSGVNSDNIDPKTEKMLAAEEKTMKQRLAEEEKVAILIPIDELNPDESAVVGLNGVIYSIPRGKEVMVPKSIKEVWDYSYIKTMEAKSRIKVANLEGKEVEVL